MGRLRPFDRQCLRHLWDIRRGLVSTDENLWQEIVDLARNLGADDREAGDNLWDLVRQRDPKNSQRVRAWLRIHCSYYPR